MMPWDNEFAGEGAGSPDPVGWRWAMALCNLLSAVTVLGFLTFVVAQAPVVKALF
jgi:hypothetical protein